MRVLVVEDNRRHAELITDELRDSDPGSGVESVETGAEALDRMRAEVFDLVVLDYRLPDTDGLELMRSMRLQGHDVPVIFVTTAESVQLAVEAMKLGAEDFVQKQEGYLAVLPLVIREALDRQRLRHEKARLEMELRQAERLASLGILAAGLAHNINNRLTSLKTFFDLIPERTPIPAFARTSSRPVAWISKDQLLVHELTRYAFSERLHPRTTQTVAELIMRAIGHLDDEIHKKRIRVRTEFGEVPRIPIDTEGMKQLLHQLAEERDSGEPGQRRDLVDPRRRGRRRSTAGGSGSRQGPGLPPEMRERCSIRSSRRRLTASGSASTSATRSRRCIEGGSTVASPDGGGAVFIVFLPVCRAITTPRPMRSSDGPAADPRLEAPIPKG